MRVLITGAGVVGSHTARELIERGDDVALFDLAPRPEFVARVVRSDIPVVRGDVRELPGLLEAIGDFRPDAIVHSAALIGRQAQRLPYRGFEVNILGTINVAEAVRLLGVRRLVHISTLGVVDRSGPQVGPVTEECQLGGNDRVYGSSKVACEQILRAYAARYGFELAMLRVASVFGFGHVATGSGPTVALFEVVQAAVEGGPAVLASGMPDADELVYVKDVARGVAQAVHVDRLAHHTYNLGRGVLATPDEILQAIRRVIPGATASRPADAGAGAGRARIEQPFDISRARTELGYEVRYDLDAGIRDMVAEMRTPQVPPAAVGADPSAQRPT